MAGDGAVRLLQDVTKNEEDGRLVLDDEGVSAPEQPEGTPQDASERQMQIGNHKRLLVFVDDIGANSERCGEAVHPREVAVVEVESRIRH